MVEGVEASPLLETKLYAPRARRGLVVRPRLVDRIDRGTESRLTLISAPAGFGKTTLVAGWLAARPAAERPVAWLSLDQSDNEPSSFWTYLVHAFQAVAPEIGGRALALLRGGQPSTEAVLATLLNELSVLPGDVVLVLDDYHVIDRLDIQDGMAFLLARMPPQMHVVITTRADPTLPLARWRGRGELVEVRAADLRFTPDEAAAYLNDVMGLDLTARDVETLEGRTEGWIVALQLAAVSMQGRDDIAGFIASFAGDDRYIVDYLVEEVLQRQPEAVRTFLLQTSILARLSGPLCDEVVAHEGGRAMLEALDRGNLFLFALDDHRGWYRYHHLFGDVLRARLLDEQPDLVHGLHRRASVWYEQNGERAEAIRHAIAGEDFERAADLVERAIPAMRRDRQEVTVRRWFEALPDELFEVRPVLSVTYAGALLSMGEIEGVERLLRNTERWLEKTSGTRPCATSSATPAVVEDGGEAELRRVPGAVAMYRAAQARMLGDVPSTILHAERVLDLVTEDDHLGRGGAVGLLALARWTTGDLGAGYRLYADASASLEKAGHLADVVGCAVALADIRIAQGRLRDALLIYDRGLRLASGTGGPVLRGAADMHVALGLVLAERDDLDGARQHLLMSQDLGQDLGLPQNQHRLYVARARIRQAEGDGQAALDLLEEAERVYQGDFFPDIHPIAAMKARLWIALGRSEDALAWASERGLTAEDDLSYLREFEHLTLARALLATSRRTAADGAMAELMRFLERLFQAAQGGDRIGSVIEILMLQALAQDRNGDIPAALVSLDRALKLAEPEGYVRVFVDEGAAMASLLEEAVKRSAAPSYVRLLLKAFGRGERTRFGSRGLAEPLSERELDVLRLLGTDLDGPDIARELVVSLNTLRTHTKNIYSKLEVTSRRAAVTRAAELDLL